MKICEEFYSIQGEGKYIGQPSYFIRFMNCNLRCVWCDSSYTWLKDDDDTIKLSNEYKKHKHIVFTGGEPLLYQDDIIKMDLNNKIVEIETNGTIPIKDENDKIFNIITCFNISPKEERFQLISATSIKHPIVLPILLKDKYLMKNYIVKFVYCDEESLKFILNIQKIYKIPASHIYIMPEGVSRDDILEKADIIIEICKKYEFNYCSREQIILWGNLRGV